MIYCIIIAFFLYFSFIFYISRHSWATTALQKGVPVSVISAGMGHASEKVTYIYLASFDNKTLSNANKKVIAAVRFKKEEEE